MTTRFAVIRRPRVQQRNHKYTIAHDVLFVVTYMKLNCFTCVYLIINLYVSIFIGSPRRSTSTNALAGEMSDSHYRSQSVHGSDDDDTIGVSGEFPHERATLNAYIFILVISSFNLY